MDAGAEPQSSGGPALTTQPSLQPASPNLLRVFILKLRQLTGTEEEGKYKSPVQISVHSPFIRCLLGTRH